MAESPPAGVEPLALINDEPVAGVSEDLLSLDAFANTVAAVALGTTGPFTIGVFGNWGCGKTSLLRIAQDMVQREKKENITAVWFNAWQYEKEEHPIVPLTATIIRALEEKRAAGIGDKLKDQADGLIRALRAVAYGFSAKTKLNIPGVAEIEADFAPKDMIERNQALRKQTVDLLLDQSLYYNAFQLLAGLHGKEAKPKERPKIVVFIDDLDRCLPDNALHLLESIKLVLAQPGFIFVLAVDQRIVESYLDLLCKDEYGQGHSYLDKIIQLPFNVPPHDSRFESFITRMLERDELKDLAADFKPFTNMLGRACNFNPREVVRFFNRMLIDRHIWSRVNEGQVFDAGAFTVARSLQNQSERTYRTLMRSPDLCADLAKGTDPIDEQLRELRRAAAREDEAGKTPTGLMRTWSSSFDDAISDLLGRPHLCDLLGTESGRRWLESEDLRQRIEQFLEVDRVKPTDADSAKIIEEAIRKTINKPEGELTPDDLNGITSLNLEDTLVTDLAPLKSLSNLQNLRLAGAPVSDFSPLESLKNLKNLWLDNMQASDEQVASLKKAQAIQTHVEPGD